MLLSYITIVILNNVVAMPFEARLRTNSTAAVQKGQLLPAFSSIVKKMEKPRFDKLHT